MVYSENREIVRLTKRHQQSYWWPLVSSYEKVRSHGSVVSFGNCSTTMQSVSVLVTCYQDTLMHSAIGGACHLAARAQYMRRYVKKDGKTEKVPTIQVWSELCASDSWPINNNRLIWNLSLPLYGVKDIQYTPLTLVCCLSLRVYHQQSSRSSFIHIILLRIDGCCMYLRKKTEVTSQPPIQTEYLPRNLVNATGTEFRVNRPSTYSKRMTGMDQQNSRMIHAM